MPIILTIAGSDPSGGAGIQADLRTIKAMGAVGLSAITALTAQNSNGVTLIEPVDPALLRAQITSLLDDGVIDSIKIGMLCSERQIDIVCDVLDRVPHIPVVLDPILASTNGVPFLSRSGQTHLIASMGSRTSLITPNLPETALITGRSIESTGEELLAARHFLTRGFSAVLIKGGHRETEVIDRLYTEDGSVYSFDTTRIETNHTHGTGCFLSTAIAVGLARRRTLIQSIRDGKDLLDQALKTPTLTGSGRGYPDLTVLLGYTAATSLHSSLVSKLNGLYLVTDPDLLRGRTYESIVRSAAAGGISAIQLRDKAASSRRLLQNGRELRKITDELGLLFIVNDRVDIALAVGADGVHLGPDDMEPTEARRLLGPNRLIGVSTGTVEEALAAMNVASYFGVGPIFATNTKADAGDSVGTERITSIRNKVRNVPVVGIGGINSSNISQVSERGAVAAAVVSAVLLTDDIREACKSLSDRFAAGLDGLN